MKVEYTILDRCVVLQINTEIPYLLLNMTDEELINKKTDLKKVFEVLDKDKRKERLTIYIGVAIEKNWKKRLTWNRFLKQIENEIWRNIKISKSQSIKEVTGTIEVPVLKAEKLLLGSWEIVTGNIENLVLGYRKLLVLLWICWKNEE